MRAVAAMAILFAAALSNNALAVFQYHDVITYSQGDWGADRSPLAGLLDDNFVTLYEVWLGDRRSILFVAVHGTNTEWRTFCQRSARPVRSTPTGSTRSSSASGTFGGEVLALRLNIDLSDAGYTLGNLGIPFGDLQLHSFTAQPLLNGLSVRQFLADVNTLLGGGHAGNYRIDELSRDRE